MSSPFLLSPSPPQRAPHPPAAPRALNRGFSLRYLLSAYLNSFERFLAISRSRL